MFFGFRNEKKSLWKTKKKTNVWNLEIGQKLKKNVEVRALATGGIFFWIKPEDVQKRVLQDSWNQIWKKSLKYDKTEKLFFDASI